MRMDDRIFCCSRWGGGYTHPLSTTVLDLKLGVKIFMLHNLNTNTEICKVLNLVKLTTKINLTMGEFFRFY